MKSIPIPYGAAFELVTGEIWLARLAIPPALQGRGLGTMTVQNLQRLGRPIILDAVPDVGQTENLDRFYARLGFKPVKNNQLRWTPAS